MLIREVEDVNIKVDTEIKSIIAEGSTEVNEKKQIFKIYGSWRGFSGNSLHIHMRSDQ